MDFFKDCLCLSTTTGQEHTYEEIELRAQQQPLSLQDRMTNLETDVSDSSLSSSPDTEVSLFSRLLTYEAYKEMEKNPFSTLYNVFIVRLDNRRDPLLQRALWTTDLHDTFSLVWQYLESWQLPCIVVIQPCEDSITGLTLLAIGTTAPINWLHTMLGNGAIMQEYFRYAGLHFTADTRSAVVTPLLPSPDASPNKHSNPHTKDTDQGSPINLKFSPLVISPDVIDSDDESIPEGDLMLYHRAVVHNY